MFSWVRHERLGRSVLAVMTLCTALRAFAAEDRQEDAVLLVSGALENDSRAQMIISAAPELLSNGFRIAEASNSARVWPVLVPSGSCPEGSTEGVAAGMAERIRVGRKLFFESMDMDGAISELDGAITLYHSSPCLGVLQPELKISVCRAGVLLTRLYLLAGQVEAASMEAGRAAARCDEAELAAEAVPPETRIFVDRAVNGRAARSGNDDAPLKVVCPLSCRDVQIDGTPVQCQDEGCLTAIANVGPGLHTVDAPGGGSWYSGEFRLAGGEELLVVAPGASPQPTGAVSLDDGTGLSPELLVSMLGVPALYLSMSDSPGQWGLGVTPVDGVPSRIARILPSGDALKFTLEPASGLSIEEDRPWPWPWVSGSLAAALLAAGITMNVFSEGALDDAIEGRNTMARYEALKGGAIAGYVTSGAGLLATILLIVLRPRADQSVLIEPSASGFRLRF